MKLRDSVDQFDEILFAVFTKHFSDEGGAFIRSDQFRF